MTGVPCGVSLWAEKTPLQCAIKAGDHSLSYGEWHARITHVTAGLSGYGVVAGDRVALLIKNSVECMTYILALLRLGAVACPINPNFPAVYREDRLAQLEPRYIIADYPVSSTVPTLSLLRMNTGASSALTEEVLGSTLAPDRPAAIIFTSGSTGAPKAAVLGLDNLRQNAQLSNQNIALAAGDIWLLSLPLYHVAGLGILFRCLEVGASIAVPNDGDPIEVSAAEGEVTHVSMVPRQLARVLATHESTKILARVKAILLGGNAIPVALINEAVVRKLPIFASYGMTEMATQITTTWPHADPETLRSSGRAQRAGVIRINNDGEIEVNGPCRFLGYWEKGALSTPFDQDGWFRTGDTGHFDLIGNLHVTGRLDNMFVCGGENVQPEMVEQAIYDLGGVERAVVVPVPHPEFGATPVAFLDETQNRSPEEMRRALATTLPSFQVPRHVFTWPHHMDTVSMKISRPRFIEEACRLLAAAESARS